MQIEEIELDEDYVKVYFTEVSTPLAISKDAFYRWLEDNEMLHWSSDPNGPDDTIERGDWDFDEYFEIPLSAIQTDINKYIQTLDL